MLTTKVLDGYSSPGGRGGITYPAQSAYEGRDTELCVPSETMVPDCAGSDQAGEGLVTFNWYGKVPDPNGQFGIAAEGSGSVGTISEVHGGS